MTVIVIACFFSVLYAAELNVGVTPVWREVLQDNEFTNYGVVSLSSPLLALGSLKGTIKLLSLDPQGILVYSQSIVSNLEIALHINEKHLYSTYVYCPMHDLYVWWTLRPDFYATGQLFPCR